MVERWFIDKRIDGEPMCFLGCFINEQGIEIQFCNYDGIVVKIKFSNPIESIEIKFLEASMLGEDSASELMSKSNSTGPLNPFFLQTLSAPVLEYGVLAIDRDFAEIYSRRHVEKNEKLTEYIMFANRTWINVFSYYPPTTEVFDAPE